MGIGDQLIATGIAKGAKNRGRRIAFGAGRKLIWDKHSKEIFKDNPNIIFPGEELSGDAEWVSYYKGRRGYNQDAGDHWVWNMSWRCIPGEVYFTKGELIVGARNAGTVVVEPDLPMWKTSSPNKDWGLSNYQELTDKFVSAGVPVSQMIHGATTRVLKGARPVETRSFRDALAVLKSSLLYVGPEGGLHHGAAAVGIRAVVLFGGFIPPAVTGYSSHTNIATSDQFCGSFKPCPHCRDAMSKISVEEVFGHSRRYL